MNADDVIESYVTEVAARLPRRQRDDVAFELRALLDEELQARAEAAGRDADAAMAIALLRDFGHPAEAAARYRPTLTIIDPADGPGFLRATVIGLALIWCAGLLAQMQQPADLLSLLGQWWTGTVIPSLWWPGVLVVGYGAAAWSRRRWPQSPGWKPRAADGIRGGRASLVMGLFAMSLGLYLLVNPHWVLDFFWGGRAAPAAYEALSYTDAFLRRQAPVLLVLVALNIPLAIAAIVSGRRPVVLRRLETFLALLTCAAMAWAVADGPIFMAASSDHTAKFFMALIVALMLAGMAASWYRRVRPTPDRTQASGNS